MSRKKMKKSIITAAAFLCCVGLTGNAAAGEVAGDEPGTKAVVSQGATADEGEAENLSGPLAMQESPADLGSRLAADMAQGSFDEVEQRFSPEMAAQLPSGTLQAVWDQTAASLGEYQEVYEVQDLGGDPDTVKVTLRYAKGGLNVNIVLDGEEIAGLWMNYYNIPEDAQSGEGYQEQEITVGEYELEGRLTLPEDVENPPVAVLIQGSGQSDMNETVGAAGNAPFRDLAQGLAQRGIATIRYNKRYYQYPEAAPANLTVQDEILEDAASAISWAAESGLVDGNRIVLLGHSLGGMLAPEIAHENPQVAAIISLAGSPRDLQDIMIDQNEELLADSGLSQEEQQEQMAQVEAEAERSRSAAQDGTEQILGAPESYWYSLNEIDGGALAQELSIPMLFLQGAEDFQVYPDKDYVMWQELLEGKENVSFRLYEGLNHMFMPTSGKRDVTEYDAPAQVDEQVLDDIADWIGAL